jgi:hypothetical protein
VGLAPTSAPTCEAAASAIIIAPRAIHVQTASVLARLVTPNALNKKAAVLPTAHVFVGSKVAARVSVFRGVDSATTLTTVLLQRIVGWGLSVC